MCGIFPVARWPCVVSQGHLCEASPLTGHERRERTTGSEQLVRWPALYYPAGVDDKDT